MLLANALTMQNLGRRWRYRGVRGNSVATGKPIFNDGYKARLKVALRELLAD